MKKGVDFIGVGVGALILNDEGKLFLSKRGREVSNESGKWEFPGGGVEFGDTLEATLKREIKEEYGVEINVGELLIIHNSIVNPKGQTGDALIGVGMDNIVTSAGAAFVAMMGGIFLGGSSLIVIFVLILCLNTILIGQISKFKNSLKEE